MGSTSKVPETTSSPWPPGSHSPNGWLAPVIGLRENNTPVPDLSAMFPNTIAWTTTAVPRRWVAARGGHGTRRRGRCSTTRTPRRWHPATGRRGRREPWRRAARRPRSGCTSAGTAAECRGRSRGLCRAARASSTSSLMPRFRMVSSMPGMDWAAPLRTLTRSGLGSAPEGSSGLVLEPGDLVPDRVAHHGVDGVVGGGEPVRAHRGGDAECRRDGQAVATHAVDPESLVAQ